MQLLKKVLHHGNLILVQHHLRVQLRQKDLHVSHPSLRFVNFGIHLYHFMLSLLLVKSSHLQELFTFLNLFSNLLKLFFTFLDYQYLPVKLLIQASLHIQQYRFLLYLLRSHLLGRINFLDHFLWFHFLIFFIMLWVEDFVLKFKLFHFHFVVNIGLSFLFDSELVVTWSY